MKKVIFGLLLVGVLVSCEKKDSETILKSSDNDVIVSVDEYLNAPDDLLTINSLEMVDDSLKINFSASGCSGDSWELKLVTNGDVMESLPPQRNLRLSLKNEEMCEAYITKEISFNINNIQVEGKSVSLNIVNSDDSVLYEY